jgi:hypothetical protein
MNIKDYIHLYIGCECLYDWTYYNETDLFGKVTSKIIEDVRSPHLSGASTNVRPLLRPLSDMTEEEFKERFYDSMREDLFDDTLQMQHEEAKRWAHDACHYPEDLRWLLSKGFDLFGLIAAGFALDKTTYQSPQIQQP